MVRLATKLCIELFILKGPDECARLASAIATNVATTTSHANIVMLIPSQDEGLIWHNNGQLINSTIMIMIKPPWSIQHLI